MELDENILNEFHARLCDLMQHVHDICVENSIRYTLIGGSLIGAIRHHGFIPWDDDMDIAMPYEDFIKFRDIVFSQKMDGMNFDLAGFSDDYFSPFIKAYDSRTTFVEGDRTENPKGIFIDVFPIVYAGNTKDEALKEFRKHRFLQSLLKRKHYRFHTGVIREAFLTVSAKFCSVNFLMGRIYRHYERLFASPKKYSSDMDGTEKGIVPSALFANYELKDFDGHKFYVISAYDEYLRLVFGDYMQLPPVDKRKPHHIAYINLDLPYLEYLKKPKKTEL